MNHWLRRVVRGINDGAEQLAAGRFDDAEASYVGVVTHLTPRFGAALGLQGLGTVALRRGDLADAVACYRVSLELSRRQKIERLRSYGGLARACLAFTHAAACELEDANRALAAPAEGEHPKACAIDVLAGALVAARRGDARASLAALERERTLLRNALAGVDAALAEALEEHALFVLARADLRPPRPVAEDAEEHAYVMRVLPSCPPTLRV
jgi:hypothetical protein